MPQQNVSAKSSAAKNNVDVAVKSTVADSTMASANKSASARLTVNAPTAYVQTLRAGCCAHYWRP